MAAAPIRIKLRCKSWDQLKAIYERDLSRGGVFLKASSPPPVGTPVRIDLTLPSGSLVVLNGEVREHVRPGGLGGRGPGIDIGLGTVPQSAMWLIETALRSAKPTGGGQTAADMAESADVVDAEDDLIQALKQEYESIRKLNPFQVLDVSYDATDQQVRAAFGALTRKYHPDRFARFESQEARRYAGEIFILIRDAYRKLDSEKVRKQAAAAIQAKPRMPASPSAPPPPLRQPTPRADGAQPVELASAAPAVGDGLRGAEALMNAGEYDNAVRAYKVAIRKNPDNRRAKAGLELVEGLRALAMRDRLEAAQRFEAVLELDPTNERAARELAEMRRIATNERKGLLSRLLGKKD